MAIPASSVDDRSPSGRSEAHDDSLEHGALPSSRSGEPRPSHGAPRDQTEEAPERAAFPVLQGSSSGFAGGKASAQSDSSPFRLDVGAPPDANEAVHSLKAPFNAARRPAMMRIRRLMLFGVLFALVATLAYWSGVRRGELSTSRRLNERPVDPANSSPKSTSSGVSDPGNSTSPGWLVSLEQAIVQVESRTADEPGGLGTGFLIDEGLIATNYHVVSTATEALVRFQNGAAYDVAGYAALDLAADLAILRLKQFPRDVVPLALGETDDPLPLSNVIAVGHPHGIRFSPTAGKVSRILEHGELPPRIRHYLQQSQANSRPARWIQHTAPLSEGNSGGPLFDGEGRVIGVNTWMDRQTRFGYAVQASRLVELQQELIDPPSPLEQHARSDARLQSFLYRLSADDIRSLVAQGQAFNWSPGSESDYETLQRLALAMTYLRHPRQSADDGEDSARWQTLARASLDATAALEGERWDSAARLTILNDLAAERVQTPSAGLFMVVTVERLVEGSDGRRGALLQMAGGKQSLFVPLDDQLQILHPGRSYLLLGMNYQGRTVEYGDNPLALISAPVVLAGLLLELP